MKTVTLNIDELEKLFELQEETALNVEEEKLYEKIKKEIAKAKEKNDK